ncbi:endonuclease III domain-containing protein [Pyrococcus abyssi]|uniref:Endonuclease III n=1 Tax=Pyrococcus abyssi (strain GE5 / Orsay) TaxID=272844 RepID=Q9V0W6_PYRAB|nr:endonuclease III [Pyrococcus abyssi]CAB49586.1 nth endonuclease III [Pyrococcus abyssi GE5]CCE70058.1 TPA: endonuclease III [Pyrococcus abyssi GE5]
MGKSSSLSERERALKIVQILKSTYPRERHVSGDPYKTLIRCIISQRNRDEVTDRVSEELFKRYPSIEAIASASVEEMQNFLRSLKVGLWRSKGKWIVETSRIILEKYKGRVPDKFEELIKLPGIGRKCANIVLAYGFGIPAIPVDTHVYRISRRLGLAPWDASPEEVEERLKELIPREEWIYVNHAMVDHGKSVCRPIKPRCDECPLKELCPRIGVQANSNQ